MNITTKQINKVPVTIIKTDKFKSVSGKIYFKSKITRKKMTYRSVLRNILLESSMKYNTPEKLYVKALENYDACYGASSSRYGNYHVTSFSFTSLIDKYTKEGNLKEVASTFCEIIFNPLVKDNAFDKDTFDIVIKRSKTYLERIKESSDAYAERMTYKNLNQKKTLYLYGRNEIPK